MSKGTEMTPRQIVEELDKYIIGQQKAKKSVAIALRNRMRRQKLPEELRDEIAPKNIIMIGPTGVGKTEIARRLSRLCDAPFVKVEATKYTEVGYVGRDVESMVRDLMSVAISMVKTEMQSKVREEAMQRTEDRIFKILYPHPTSDKMDIPSAKDTTEVITVSEDGKAKAEKQSTADKMRLMLKQGKFDDKKIEIDVNNRKSFPSMQVFSGTSFEEMDINIGNLSGLFGGKKKKKQVTVKQAKDFLLGEEMDKLVDMDNVTDIARQRVEEMGIIFLDEIDKIATTENRRGGGDVSREGVQRDILPIVEGSKVNTRYGIVDTAHILFIAAGAFHMSKPSDLIPELQGRFPLRVELQALTRDDFISILTQPQNALIKQYVELLKTEDVILEFKEEAIERIAEIASEVNSKSENIGARRLHTILENLLEDVSFDAPELAGQTVVINREQVDKKLADIIEDRDLTKFIL